MRISKPKILTLAALAAALWMVAAAAACRGKGGAAAKAPAPAAISHPVKEDALTVLTLTPQAVERLGIATVRAERRPVPRVLRLGGEIVARPGQEATVSAPAAGVVLPPDDGRFPAAGSRVGRGRAVMRFLILPADKDPVGAKADLEVKRVRLETASEKVRRTQALLRDKAVSEKADQEARAELAEAQASFDSARARWDVLSGGSAAAASTGLTTQVLISPLDGLITRLEAGEGQAVTAGAPLFAVASLHPVWVKVPVYVGDLASVDPSRPARIEPLGAPAGDAGLEARAVQGPPSADPSAASADLYFELDNSAGAHRLGQKVGVALTLRAMEDALVVPWSAVLFDMTGGAWVYEKTGPAAFARRRVDVRYVAGGEAVLGRGPEAGAEIVATGAAELFGTEFGAGK
jgi:RND family efflux transporter MFP subunit